MSSAKWFHLPNISGVWPDYCLSEGTSHMSIGNKDSEDLAPKIISVVRRLRQEGHKQKFRLGFKQQKVWDIKKSNEMILFVAAYFFPKIYCYNALLEGLRRVGIEKP